MTLLRRPAPRFVVWAAVLVGVAAAAGVAGLSAWIIAGLEFVAWVLVAMCERTLSGPWTVPDRRVYLEPRAQVERVEVHPHVEHAASESSAAEWPPEPLPPAHVARETPGEQVAAAVPQPPVAQPRPAAAAASIEGTQWNLWTLERIAQEQAPDNEELGFLIVYLRDFAGADGLLPAGFDSLVRESFGALLPRAG